MIFSLSKCSCQIFAFHATAVERGASHRKGEEYQFKERACYKALSGAEKDDIGIENPYFWDDKTV